MPNRFSLQLRPRYNPDEPSAGHAIASVIQEFLAKREQSSEEDRAFRNSVAEAGGTITETQSPESRRLDNLKRRLLRKPRQTSDSRPRSSPSIGSMIPGEQGHDVKIPIVGINADAEPLTLEFPKTSSVPRDTIATNEPRSMPGTPNTIGQAIMSMTPEVAPYEIEGPRGMRARIDPMHRTRVGLAGKVMESDIERDARRRETEGDTQAKIQSLVDAGIDPKVARARVLNNVVRYDETFGQPARTSGSLTFEQRRELEDIKTKRSVLVQQMVSARKSNDTLAQQRLGLQQRALDIRLAQIMNDVDKQDILINSEPKGMTGLLSEDEKGGGATQVRANRRQEAVDRMRNRTEKAGQQTKPTLSERIDQLKADGVSKTEARSILRREGYHIK